MTARLPLPPLTRSARVTRREFMLGAACCCCAPALPRAVHAQGATVITEEIAPGVHVRRGVDELAARANDDAIANIGFIIGDESVAVLDPGGSLVDGERLRRRIRQLTERPIRYVLMSHAHPDHIFGAGAFLQDQPEFVGHARLSAALAHRGEYYRTRLEEMLGPGAAGKVVAPTLRIENLTRIDLGGRVLELRAHPPAHTDHDLSVLDVRTRTLFTGDLLFVGRAPSLDGSLKGWLSELTALGALNLQRAAPGHGPAAVKFSAAANDLQRYLTGLLTETRQAIAGGVEIDAAAARVGQMERSRWSLFDEYHEHNVIQAYKELEWE